MITTLNILLAALLLTCLAEMPYGYYQFVRFAGLVGFAVLAYNSFQTEEKRMAIVYVCLALLFQPFIKVALGRTIWNIVDVVVTILLLLTVFIGRKRARVSDCSGYPAATKERGVRAEGVTVRFCEPARPN